MKQVFLWLFFACPLGCLSQTADNTYRLNPFNVYFVSMVQVTNYMAEKNTGIRDTILIETNSPLTDSILEKSKELLFKKVLFSDLQDELKTKKKLTLFRIHPIDFANGEFFVSITPFGVSKGRKKNNLKYFNSGGYKVFFRYENSGFLFTRIEDCGI